MRIDYCPSQRTSLGIEWELQLVDLQTRELVSASDELLHAIAPEGEHPKAKHELLQSCVEVITGVCQSVAQAREDLAGTVGELAGLAAGADVGLLCAGTHPFSNWSEQRITETSRYQDLVERNQIVAKQMQIFGVHVHCGVRSEHKALPIVNALSAYIPHFLALSASSPYWLGRDTGLASYRSKVFEALPTAGLPYQLEAWGDFEAYVQALVCAGAIGSIREIWWDIRPHPGFGTVELRICDGVPTLKEIAAIAALAQCLVERFDRQLDDGYLLPVPLPWLVRENKWRAARYGLDAHIIVDNAGDVVSVREAITDLVADLEPTARRLDCLEELVSVLDVLADGGSYQRQRQRGASGDLRAVVDLLREEMTSGL